MKSDFTKAIAFISLAIITVGCKPSDDQSRAGETVTNTWEATKDYAYAQKEEFMAKMRVESEKLKQEVKALGDKIEKDAATARTAAQPKLDELRQKIAKLDQQLEATKNSTASSWEDVKAGFKKSSEDLKNSLDQARQWLTEKIAPAPSSTNQ